MKKYTLLVLLGISLNVFGATTEDNCLAVAIHKEASQTNVIDQKAVYQVIKNRMRKENKTACSVIKEPSQFSFVTKRTNWSATKPMLKKLSVAKNHPKVIGENVLWYHNTSVNPRWNRKLKLVKKIDGHRYYAKYKTS